MSAVVQGPRPVAANERIALLDVLRGFALAGVLVANIVPWFSSGAFVPRAGAEAAVGSADEAAMIFLRLFVFGKAMGLLVLLFGAGFAMQLERAEAIGKSIVGTHVRRMAGLFVIGALHVILLWWGDILTSYAIGGLFLVFFRKNAPRALVFWACFFVFVPQLVTLLPPIAAVLERLDPHAHDREAFSAALLAAMRGHDRLELTRMHVQQAIAHVAPAVGSYYFWVLGHLLLGMALGKTGVLTSPEKPSSVTFFRRALAWGLGVGLSGSIGMMVFSKYVPRRSLPMPLRLAVGTVGDIWAMALALAYLSAVALLMRRPAWLRWMMPIAPVGRMALTTYVMQSLVCTTLFYGFGFGLSGKVGPALAIPLASLIFAAQALFARLWLARLRFGPLEWVWRRMTYGKLRGAEEVKDNPPASSPRSTP